MVRIILREEIEVTIDENIVDFLLQFQASSWYRLSNTVKLNARAQEKKLVDGYRLITLNRLVWWFNHKEWPDEQNRLRHLNNEELDFRLENLISQTPKEIIKSNTIPAAEDKGIYKDPKAGGKYRVRGYSSVIGRVIYIGHRKTLKEAIKLKQEFLQKGPGISVEYQKITNLILSNMNDDEIIDFLSRRMLLVSQKEDADKSGLTSKIYALLQYSNHKL